MGNDKFYWCPVAPILQVTERAGAELYEFLGRISQAPSFLTQVDCAFVPNSELNIVDGHPRRAARFELRGQRLQKHFPAFWQLQVFAFSFALLAVRRRAC